MVNILNKISLKNMQIVILLYQLHHNLSCIIVRTLLNRHFKHSQNFIDGKSLYLVSIFDKILSSKCANRDIIASITPRLNQELDITGLPSSFYMTPSEIFIRNNKNMVNILNKISLKNMQIVILLYQLHHNLSCIIVRTLLNRHFKHSQNFIDGKSLYLVSIFD